VSRSRRVELVGRRYQRDRTTFHYEPKVDLEDGPCETCGDPAIRGLTVCAEHIPPYEPYKGRKQW
jgi:hypothetical protein